MKIYAILGWLSLLMLSTSSEIEPNREAVVDLPEAPSAPILIDADLEEDQEKKEELPTSAPILNSTSPSNKNNKVNYRQRKQTQRRRYVSRKQYKEDDSENYSGRSNDSSSESRRSDLWLNHHNIQSYSYLCWKDSLYTKHISISLLLLSFSIQPSPLPFYALMRSFSSLLWFCSFLRWRRVWSTSLQTLERLSTRW